MGPIVKDDPIFAEEQVEFYGQALFVVVAETYQQARKAVRLAQIEYVPETPILTIQDAIEKESWVLPLLNLAMVKLSKHFKMQPINFQVLLSWVGKSILFRRSDFLCDSTRKSELKSLLLDTTSNRNAVTDLSCIRHEYASGQCGESPYGWRFWW